MSSRAMRVRFSYIVLFSSESFASSFIQYRGEINLLSEKNVVVIVKSFCILLLSHHCRYRVGSPWMTNLYNLRDVSSSIL